MSYSPYRPLEQRTKSDFILYRVYHSYRVLHSYRFIIVWADVNKHKQVFLPVTTLQSGL